MLLVLVAVTRPLGDVGDVHHCSDTEVAPRHPQTVIHAQNKMVEEGEGRGSPQGFGDTSAGLCWGSPVPGQGVVCLGQGQPGGDSVGRQGKGTVGAAQGHHRARCDGWEGSRVVARESLGVSMEPTPPEMPKGRRRPVLSLRLWLSRRSMRPTRMIWHTRNSRSRFRSVLPRSWDRTG